MRPAHILLANIPEHGHINPTLAIVAELVRRGHRVSYPSTAEFAGVVEGAGATPLLYTSTLPSGQGEDEWPTDLTAGLARFLTEAEAVVPRLLDNFDADRPDLIAYDIAAHGAGVLARSWGVPSVQLSPTHAIGGKLAADFDRIHARRPEWIAHRARFHGFLERYGIDASLEAYHAPERCVVMIPREFQAGRQTFPENYSFVGPCIRAADAAPWPAGSAWTPPPAERKLLYVALGSCYSNRPNFYRDCFEAFGHLEPWHVVFSVGGRVDPQSLGALPGNAEVHRSVPQLEVLARASAFVTHGGMGSVLEAMSHAVPMVVVPQAVDQPMNARRIAKLGLGTWLAPAQATAEALSDAVLSVSTSPEIAAKLAQMRRVIAAYGGASAAADVIEGCVPAFR